MPGQPPAVLQYFSVLLEKGVLNRMETLELARPVIAQGRKDLIEKWIQDGKLDWSEELGDAVRPLDPKLALQVFLKAGAKEKIVLLLAESGQFAQARQSKKKKKKKKKKKDSFFSPSFCSWCNGALLSVTLLIGCALWRNCWRRTRRVPSTWPSCFWLLRAVRLERKTKPSMKIFRDDWFFSLFFLFIYFWLMFRVSSFQIFLTEFFVKDLWPIALLWSRCSSRATCCKRPLPSCWTSWLVTSPRTELCRPVCWSSTCVRPLRYAFAEGKYHL